LTTLFATILITCGKVNFTNLSRYSSLSEKPFDFMKFNAQVIRAATDESQPMIAVMDCSFIAKSGKKTFGLDSFYNSTDNRVETGLEVSLVAVVDVKTQMGYALLAQQTFTQTEFPSLTRMDYYLLHLEAVRPHLPSSVRYLAVDGYYAKESLVTGATALKLHVMSKLRCDANLRYVFVGQQKARLARRKYDGKVDLTNPSRFTRGEPAATRDRALHGGCVAYFSQTQNSVGISQGQPSAQQTELYCLILD
jgi:hypothetical protein